MSIEQEIEASWESTLTVGMIEGTYDSINYHSLTGKGLSMVQRISTDQLGLLINGNAIKFAFGNDTIIVCVEKEDYNNE